MRGPEALSKAEQQGFRDALLREAVNSAEQEARRQEGEAQFQPDREEQGRRLSTKADASQSGGSEVEPGEAKVTNSFVLFLRENRYWFLTIAAGMAVLVWFMSPSLDGRRGPARNRADQQAATATSRTHRHKPRSRR
ncbi:MAG: hypothetical protein IPO19_00020 [Rhodoferax sp.]|nr:hypothetical protein [Rhodoferax sp.]